NPPVGLVLPNRGYHYRASYRGTSARRPASLVGFPQGPPPSRLELCRLFFLRPREGFRRTPPVQRSRFSQNGHTRGSITGNGAPRCASIFAKFRSAAMNASSHRHPIRPNLLRPSPPSRQKTTL